MSMRSGQQSAKPVSSLAPLLPAMIGFHRRYRVSNKILRLWADMVSGLKINMIAPQHGAPLVGAAVGEFIDWARGLHCGIDLMGPTDHQVPA